MRRAVVISVLLIALVVPSHGESGEKFHVLVVNDDGIDAPGIAALVSVLAEDPAYRISVVAPAEQQSGKGSALTLRGDIVVRPHAPIHGVTSWSVTATPATALRVGLEYLLVESPPDLVVSGINKGENVGRIAWYSGTVGAARESVLRGTPAIAFSLQLNWAEPDPDFDGAARWAKPVVDAIRMNSLPNGVYLNVNIPDQVDTIVGYRLCHMGLERPLVSGFEVVKQEDDALFLKGRWAPARSDEVGSDVTALHGGYVSIAPLGIDSTEYMAFARLQPLMRLDPPHDSAID